MRVGFDASIVNLKSSKLVQDRHLDSGLGPASRGERALQRHHGGERRRRRWDADDFRMPVEVGANQSQRFTAYARPGSRQPEFTVRLLDQQGRRVGGASQETAMPQPPESIMPDESLILTMGRPQGVETIAELPGFKAASRATCPRRRRRNRDGTNRPSSRLDARPLVRLRRGKSHRRRYRRPRDGGIARRACAASRWSTGSREVAISSSRSAPTGRRCVTASWRRSCRGCPAVKRRWLRWKRSIPSRARTSRSLRPARHR